MGRKGKPSDQRTLGTAGHLLHFFTRAAHVVQDRVGTANEGFPSWRECHAASAPLKQRRTELVLKLINAAR